MSSDLIRVRGLQTRFYTDEGTVHAVDSVDFDIREGETFGIVGESGSGKTVTALSLLDLVRSPGRVTGGELWYRHEQLVEKHREENPEWVTGEYVDVYELPEEERSLLRGTSFSMVFQDPMRSFNPSKTVGKQVAEAVEVQRQAEFNPRSTRSRTKNYTLGSFLRDALQPGKGFVSNRSKERAVELLETVGVPDPRQRADEYPHQYSGGMLQRAMIAQALASEPDLLVADEPTSSLDVTIQSQILNLLDELKADHGMSILLISHNLGVVARTCDRVGVMYAGELVENGPLEDVFYRPTHPYTEGLLNSIPDFELPDQQLRPIAGNVPSLLAAEKREGCSFADRCPKAMERCLEDPPRYETSDGHEAKCYLATEPYDPDSALDTRSDEPTNEMDE